MGERGPCSCMFSIAHTPDKLFSAGSGIGTVVSFSQAANKTPGIHMLASGLGRAFLFRNHCCCSLFNNLASTSTAFVVRHLLACLPEAGNAVPCHLLGFGRTQQGLDPLHVLSFGWSWFLCLEILQVAIQSGCTFTASFLKAASSCLSEDSLVTVLDMPYN